MDSKVSSRSTKKSNSLNRKKKRHRKRESGGRGCEQSPPAGGKHGGGREREGRDTDTRPPVVGKLDSGGDTDSRDSGLEADCRPHSEQIGFRRPGSLLDGRQTSLISALDREPHLTAAKVKTDSSRSDTRVRDRLGALREKPVGGRLHGGPAGQWAAPSGALTGKTSGGSLGDGRAAPQCRSSLPNIPATRHELTTHGGGRHGGAAARGSTSGGALLSGSHSGSSLPLVVQISTETLRWEHALDDSEDEAERMRIYKLNRRKRYIAASNVKYEDWVAGSASATSLSAMSSASGAHGSRSACADPADGMDAAHNIHANLVASNKTLANMYDEYSQLVFTQPPGGGGHRIPVNC